MKTITKTAWDRVLAKACDVANATEVDSDPMYEVHRGQMLEILDDLEKEFGVYPEILDTRADYLDDPLERRKLYTEALRLARESDNQRMVNVVLESLREFDEDIKMEVMSKASTKKAEQGGAGNPAKPGA